MSRFSFLILVLFIVLRLLIDGVVREMHVEIVVIIRFGQIIRGGGKPSHSFFKNEYFQRFDLCDQDVNS